MSSGTLKKKSSSKAKISDKHLKPSESHPLSSSSKNILKKNVLFPKKKQPKEKLGTTISDLGEDQRRIPGDAPSETAVVDLEDSGSEYVPSGTDG